MELTKMCSCTITSCIMLGQLFYWDLLFYYNKHQKQDDPTQLCIISTDGVPFLMKSTTCFTVKAFPPFLIPDGLYTTVLLLYHCSLQHSWMKFTQKSNKPKLTCKKWMKCARSPLSLQWYKHLLQVVLSPQTPQGPFSVYLFFHWCIFASWLHNKAPSYPQVILEGHFWIERAGWEGN